ncbi:MAG TPA: 16S rRNA (cytosine(1402)-N(4))-methyltransferase RsmH, partial [Clostridiaceae bacterium]|nr:16S rRNA (cytosine(1402)-N(4))-methyltransferase RsmH [Clostridiaceae bacterium]
MGFEHKPVMLEECIEFLAVRPDGVYVDCTLGGGGHSAGILRRLGPEGTLIGLDQDKNAVKAAECRLSEIDTKAKVVIENTNFENIREVLEVQKIESVDGILLDLGVSSHQLDEGERGFSYQHDAPLDMRMNQDDSFNA